MQTIRLVPALAISTIVLVFCANHARGQVIVKGTTLRVEPNGEYVPLPRVSIRAYREGPILPAADFSDSKGVYRVTVSEGYPFRIAYYLSDQYVPEIQPLAGKKQLTHNIHVALWSVEEYRRQEERGLLIPLRTKLRHLLEQLPKEQDELRQIIQKMLSPLE